MKTPHDLASAARAPELHVSQWLGSNPPPSLAALCGRVVVLHAFQMLCPACVSHGIPQATKIHNTFGPEDVVVLGLHTVFEHHAVMGPDALQVFMHEYRVPFPVGIDLAVAGQSVPQTMQSYGMRGTPSLVVVDRHGAVALSHFGMLDDLRLGAFLGQLVAQPA